MLKPVKKNDSEYNMHHEYFHCSNELIEKYGEHSVVLMQLGAFFEIYGFYNIRAANVFEKICGWWLLKHTGVQSF